MNTWVALSQGPHCLIENKGLKKVYIHILMLLYRCLWRISPLCILVTHFEGGSRPMGWVDPKEPGNLFFFSLLNLPISHFQEVPVPLTHFQGPSQSPFVNRTMFYNSPSLSDDRINNAEEPHLSGAMRLFLWFGLTVMVIVWQTIYSSNNDHRLQLFSDQRDCREAHDWLLTKRQSHAVQPPTFHFCLSTLIMEKIPLIFLGILFSHT